MHEGKNGSSRKRRHMRIKVLLVLCVAATYVLLLIPYMIHANLGNSGSVIYSNEIMLESLPEAVQELCRLRGIMTPVILLVKHPLPDRVTMVVTSEKISLDTVVEMTDYIVNWRVDWRDFSSLNPVDQTFERFAIANVRQLGPLESNAEIFFSTQLGRIIHSLSRVDFYAGPILVILCITVFLQGRLALWNLPAIFGCYSLQVWRLNALAYGHHLVVAAESEYFGYFFAVLLPLSIYAWHFERSKGGQYIADKMRALSEALGLSRE